MKAAFRRMLLAGTVAAVWWLAVWFTRAAPDAAPGNVSSWTPGLGVIVGALLAVIGLMCVGLYAPGRLGYISDILDKSRR